MEGRGTETADAAAGLGGCDLRETGVAAFADFGLTAFAADASLFGGREGGGLWCGHGVVMCAVDEGGWCLGGDRGGGGADGVEVDWWLRLLGAAGGDVLISRARMTWKLFHVLFGGITREVSRRGLSVCGERKGLIPRDLNFLTG